MTGRLRINSLGARLSVWVAVVMVVSFGAIFLVVYRDTSSRLRGEIDHDVRENARHLARAVTDGPHASASVVLATARAYVSSRPYGDTSPLLFVVVSGVGAASNHPELFGSTPAGGQLLRLSRGYSTTNLPGVGPVRIYELLIAASGHQAFAAAGEPYASLIRTQKGIKRSFLLGGSVAVVLAVLASYIVGAGVSAPLRRLASLAARIDAGDLEPRMDVTPASSVEIRMLADAINHMLDRLADAFSAQREFVADASHELRTPLTVMRGELELLSMTKNPSDQELLDFQRRVQSEITRVGRLVDDLLVLAQAERGDFLRASPIRVRRLIPELWDGVKLTAQRDFQLGELPDAVLVADPDRLTQALRNLARNAIEHTAAPNGVVRLEVTLDDSASITFAVLDDGPGIPAEERERIFERFHRSDPARTRADGGAGLGLAIVLAIAEAHNGRVAAGDSPYGGARVEITLPTVVATDEADAAQRRPAASAGPGGVRPPA